MLANAEHRYVEYGQAESREPARHVLVGHSPRTRQVLRMIEKLGRCRWPGLLLGETGTGKEVVARLIHNISGPQEPFVTIDALRMAKKKMFFTSAKAERELGYQARPAREAIADAYAWFHQNGYC